MSEAKPMRGAVEAPGATAEESQGRGGARPAIEGQKQ